MKHITHISWLDREQPSVGANVYTVVLSFIDGKKYYPIEMSHCMRHRCEKRSLMLRRQVMFAPLLIFIMI